MENETGQSSSNKERILLFFATKNGNAFLVKNFIQCKHFFELELRRRFKMFAKETKCTLEKENSGTK
jgi:hypothetical protein